MGTKHPQALAFVSVSDLIRDKSINAATEHEACYHPFVISTSFMTPDHEENVKDAKEEDHDDLDTIDECYEYTKNMMRTKITVPNCPNKLGDGTIKKLSPETIKNSSASPTATSQTGEFLENCSLVTSGQRPGRDTALTQRPASKVSLDIYSPPQ